MAAEQPTPLPRLGPTLQLPGPVRIPAPDQDVGPKEPTVFPPGTFRGLSMPPLGGYPGYPAQNPPTYGLPATSKGSGKGAGNPFGLSQQLPLGGSKGGGVGGGGPPAMGKGPGG